MPKRKISYINTLPGSAEDSKIILLIFLEFELMVYNFLSICIFYILAKLKSLSVRSGGNKPKRKRLR
jgi:hypothetical protein